MSRIQVGLLSLLVLGVLVASAPAGTIGTIYFTSTPYGTTPAQTNPSVSTTVGGIVHLYIWALGPTSGSTNAQTYINLAVNGVMNTPGIATSSVTVQDPGQGYDAGQTNGGWDQNFRWNFDLGNGDDPLAANQVVHGYGNGSATANGGWSNASGATVTSGYGIRNVNAAPYNADPLRDAATGAFLFAIVDITGVAQGTTTLDLSVGAGGIVMKSGSAGSTYFGAGETGTGVLGNNFGATGAIHDATITVTPEPATMVLLALGGLGVLARRRSRS